jgi:chaperonin cofactor prefoldin
MELDKYGLTREAILNGDYAELDPVEKPRKEKRPMYLAEVADKIIEDTFTDLRAAYLEIDQLTDENAKLKETVDQDQVAITKAKGDAMIKQQDDARLKKVEDLLSDMEKSFETYKENKAKDDKEIAELQKKLADAPSSDEVDKLRARVSELQTLDQDREEKYRELAADVNNVLDALEEKFSNLSVDTPTEPNVEK